MPAWYDAIGSLSRGTVLGHAHEIPDIERRLVTTEVDCLTADALLERHRVDRLDLVLVDVEGADARVLSGLDLERWRPRLVAYEHYHLAADVRASCRARLERHGYEAMEEGLDTFCLHRDDPLIERFRRLRPVAPGLTASEHRP